MQQPRRTQAWSLSAVLSTLTSLVCMGSMGATGAAASVGAAATSSMSGMDGMGTMATPVPGHVALTTQLFQSIGLGELTQMPDSILRPIFIILLLVGIVGSYLSYRVHSRLLPFILTILASVVLYLSIYVLASDPLYYASLSLLLVVALGNVLIRPRRAVEQPA